MDVTRTFAAMVFVTACMPALAQSYPFKPVRLVVPFTAGAATDTISRVMAQKLTDAFGHNVVVDNRPGGGAVIGSDIVARAAPDGHTLLVTTPSFVIGATGTRKLPYDPVKDFSPVTQFASTPLVLIVHPSFAPRTLAELIALAKSRPGQINYASAGNGSPTHLGVELLRNAGVVMTHIPYKGAAPALTDVLGGQVPLMMTSIIAAAPHVTSGRLHALAVTTAKRSSAMPSVPTIGETVPGYEVVNWWGVLAPGATPPAIISRLHTELVRMLREADVRERLAREGAEPVGSTPQAFGEFIRTDIARLAAVIRQNGIRID